MKRILQVGLGPLGHRILSEVIERDAGHVTAAVDTDPRFAGKPLAEFIPGADPKIRVQSSLQAIAHWNDIDAAIVATSSDLPHCAPTFRELLRRGKAVVSTCEELIYPWLRHVALAEELDDLAKANGGRLLGTGVNPGFLMDALPLFLTSVCKNVKTIKCHRIQDASARRIPFQKKIGVGLDDAQFAAKVKEGTLRHVGLGESLHFLSHYAGIPIERWEEDIAPVKADRDMTSGVGPVPRGMVSGVRQVARGFRDEQTVLHLEFQAAIGQHEPHDRIVIEGDPHLDVVIPGAVHGDTATCAIVVNAIPQILSAAPGLHTMATIPPLHYRARG